MADNEFSLAREGSDERVKKVLSDFNRTVADNGMGDKPFSEVLLYLDAPATFGEMAYFNLLQSDINFSVAKYLVALKAGKEGDLDEVLNGTRRYFAETINELNIKFNEKVARQVLDEDGANNGRG